MAKTPARAKAVRNAIAITAALMMVCELCSNAYAAFLINCAGCHTVPQNGMAITNYQAITNLGNGLRKVFKVSPGQTAVIQLNVTNGYGGNYALNINNLGAGGVNNSNDYLACTADPAWTSYFTGTATNFFMLGCFNTSPNLCSFNLLVKTNTPADFYTINCQMAGYSSTSTMWSQQESFYIQVAAACRMVVSINGVGFLSTNYNGALLQVGSSYTITATAGAGFVFTNWTGGTSLPLTVLTNGPTVQFIMESNLMLQANYVETSRPSLTITAPTNNQHMTNAIACVTGTASDLWGVSNVWYKQQ